VDNGAAAAQVWLKSHLWVMVTGSALKTGEFTQLTG
jgi:hypothetical protein